MRSLRGWQRIRVRYALWLLASLCPAEPGLACRCWPRSRRWSCLSEICALSAFRPLTKMRFGSACSKRRIDKLLRTRSAFFSLLLPATCPDWLPPFSQNVRLKEVVRQLGESLEQQREATKREDAEVLALLAAKLQARSSTHLRSLEETFATVRRNVEEVSAHNSKGVDSRRGHLGILEKSNADAQAALECQARSVEEIALHQREVSRLRV